MRGVVGRLICILFVYYTKRADYLLLIKILSKEPLLARVGVSRDDAPTRRAYVMTRA